MAAKVSASGTSFGEHFIAAVFEKASCDVKMRSLDLGFEIDVLIEDLKLGIEYGAWYWHADKTDKDKKKISQAKEQEYTIYCIYDDVPQDVEPSSVAHAYCLDKGTTPRDIETIKLVLWNILVQYNLVSGNADDFDWEGCIQSANFNRQQAPVPFERSLASCEDVLHEWDYERNYPVLPEQIFKNSSGKYWWKCKNGHDYLMEPYRKTGSKHQGCPICANRRLSSDYNSFAAQYPHLLDYWDFDENPESPYEIFPTEYIKQDWRWKCPVCGYKWSTVAAQPVLYAEAELCPQCRQAARLDEVLDDIHIATRRSSIVISPSIARFSSVRYSSPEREQIETLVRKTLREHLDAVSADADYWYVETDYLFCRISKVNVQAIQEFYLVEPEQSLGEKVYLDKRFCCCKSFSARRSCCFSFCLIESLGRLSSQA